jgi:RNA polymerase sigma factor (sigma-70 family)
MSPKGDISSSAPEPTDEQLMAAFQAGDQAAFDTIDHRHRPGITGFICNELHGGLRQNVDDLVQDVFAKLVEARDTYTVVYSNNYVANFLYRTAHSLVKDHLRRQLAQKRDCRRNALPLHPKLIDSKGASRDAARREVADFLEYLTPAEAEAVRLGDFEEHTGKSAAEALGISQSTFEWRYLKAHKHLEQIAADLEDEGPQ